MASLAIHSFTKSNGQPGGSSVPFVSPLLSHAVHSTQAHPASPAQEQGRMTHPPRSLQYSQELTVPTGTCAGPTARHPVAQPPENHTTLPQLQIESTQATDAAASIQSQG